MRIKYTVLLLFAGFLGFAQSPNNSTTEGYSKMPVSPTAASLGQYGTIPVGLFSGTAQYNLPLYTVQGKNLNVPIELNYSTNGIKVEAISPWVGIGWSLEAGGVITRDVKDRADTFQSYTMPNSSTGCLTIADSKKFEDANSDLDYDRFSYNFMGNTGTFYIANGVVKQIEEGNGLKFQVTATNPTEFIVTDKNGIKYYFGKNYVAGNGNVDPVESTSIGDTGPLNSTSWYMAKMVHWNGETIYFTYKAGNLISKYPIGYNQYRTRPISTEYSCPECAVPTETWSNLSQVRANEYRNVTVFLSSIYTDDLMDRVDFYIDNETDKLKVIKGVQKNIELTIYCPVATPGYRLTDRYYLDQVNFKSTDATFNIQGEKYKFDYYDKLNVPARYTPSRDKYGYYNGAQNTASTPLNLLEGNHAGNPDYGKNGSLKTITYPTGGYTELEYEGNTRTTYNQCVVGPVQTDGWHQGAGNYYEALDDENMYSFTITDSQNVVFHLSQEFTIAQPNLNSNVFGDAHFALMKLNGPGNPDLVFTNANQNYVGTRDITKYLTPGDYKIGVSVRHAQYRARFTFTTCSNSTVIEELGGIRLKNTKSYPDANANPTIKSYSYDGLEVAVMNRISYSYNSTSGSTCSTPGINAYCATLMESSTGALSPNGSPNEFFYKKVTEKFLEGTDLSYYIEHEFIASPLSSGAASLYGCNIPSNFEIVYFGTPKESKTTYYKKINSTTFVKRKIEEFDNGYTYEIGDASYKKQIITNGNTAHSYATSQGLTCVNVNYPYSFSARMNLARYTYNRVWQKLNSKTDTENIFDANNNIVGTIVNKSDYYYDNVLHKQLTREVKRTSEFAAGSSTAKTLTIKYSYPDDVTSVSSLYGGTLSPANYSALLQMKSMSANIIGNPIQIEKLDDALDHLETTRYCYERFTASNFCLPTKVQTMKGNTSAINYLVDNQYFSNYNFSVLRPQQITGTGNTNPTCYIYGYKNRYPIAIIKNKVFDNSVTALINSYSNNADYTDGDYLNIYNTLNAIGGTLFTLYKYKPIVGVEKIIESTADFKKFNYDALNRLINVKDKNDKILSESAYHFKP